MLTDFSRTLALLTLAAVLPVGCASVSQKSAQAQSQAQISEGQAAQEPAPSQYFSGASGARATPIFHQPYEVANHNRYYDHGDPLLRSQDSNKIELADDADETTPMATPASAPPTGESAPATPAPAPKLNAKDIPAATRSRPGRVKLPFPPFSEIDVSGMPSGSLAKDPVSGRVFRIP